MLRVRVVFTSAIGGSPFLATHYFIHGDTQAAADAAVAATGTFWGAVDAFMDSECSWATESEVAVLTTAGVLEGILATTPATGTGAVGGSAVPKVANGLIRWITPAFIGGRRLRGRTFVPNLSTGSLNNGIVAAATVTGLNAAAAAFIADATTTLAVWSKTSSTAANVATASTWTEFASLRSRRQ